MKFVTLIAISVTLTGCGMTDADALHGREKADALVEAYSRHVGAGEAHLDTNDDRSFGDFGFRYDPQRDELTARVYIARTHLYDWGPKATAATLSTVRGLNDAKIGGMFETDGGHFVLDEKADIIFLVKAFPVDSISRQAFVSRVDDLRGLAGLWFTQWFGHAANMAHGHEPPPTHKITRQNNPYHP